jgi:hypothetical protein
VDGDSAEIPVGNFEGETNLLFHLDHVKTNPDDVDSHNILQARVSRPFSTLQNSIQDPLPRWILMIFKLKFGGGNQL